jgi:hypothetical protein
VGENSYEAIVEVMARGAKAVVLVPVFRLDVG